MRNRSTVTRRLPPAFWCGLAALAAAIGLGSIQIQLATVPLAMFVTACLTAPFLPGRGFFLPVVSRGTTGQPLVALTFDDGPDPVSTPALLAFLARRNIRATFFVIGWRAAKYPQLIAAILDGGHSIGNHSYRHSYLALLRGPQALRKEITDAQEILAHFNIQPLAFRPPVGITTPGLGRVLEQLGLYAVNFRFRTFDRGNRRLRNLSRFTLARTRPDDILGLHDLNPPGDQGIARWLGEVKRIVDGLENKGLTITSLEKLIDRPVMRKVKTGRRLKTEG